MRAFSGRFTKMDEILCTRLMDELLQDIEDSKIEEKFIEQLEELKDRLEHPKKKMKDGEEPLRSFKEEFQKIIYYFRRDMPKELVDWCSGVMNAKLQMIPEGEVDHW